MVFSCGLSLPAVRKRTVVAVALPEWIEALKASSVYALSFGVFFFGEWAMRMLGLRLVIDAVGSFH